MTTLEILKIIASMLGGLALFLAGMSMMSRVAERLLGMISEIRESAEQMTEQDRKEILIVGEAIQEVIQLTFKGYKARTPNISRTIRCYTEEVMALGDIVKKRFMKRVHEDGRQRSGSTLFTDICYAEEQLVDYCDMIAEAMIRYDRENGESRQGNSVSDQQLRRQVHEMFRDKFEELERA